MYGSWPNDYNEVVLVLDENNELDDMALYALGLKPQEEMDAIMQAAVDQTEVELEDQSWTYEEICSREYKTVLNADCYAYDEASGLYVDLRDTDAGLRYLYDNGITLQVSGIIRPNEDASAHMLSGSIGYTSALTEHLAQAAAGFRRRPGPAGQPQPGHLHRPALPGEHRQPHRRGEGEPPSGSYVSGLEEQEARPRPTWPSRACPPRSRSTRRWGSPPAP